MRYSVGLRYSGSHAVFEMLPVLRVRFTPHSSNPSLIDIHPSNGEWISGAKSSSKEFGTVHHPATRADQELQLSEKNTMYNQQQRRWRLLRQRQSVGLLLLPTIGIFTGKSHAFTFLSPPHPNQRSSRTIVAVNKEGSDDVLRSPLQDHLGPPQELVDLAIGERLGVQKSDRQKFTVERISDEPHAFVLRNFLSEEQCNEIIQKAEDQGMETAETKDEEGSNSRQNCGVAWLSSFPLEKQLVKDIRSLLIQEEVASSSDLMVELLQVLKYNEGGLYQIHHDGEPRFLTVIYYLNGVGATWFPFATLGDWDPCNGIPTVKGAEDLRERFHHIRQGKEGASMDVGESLEPGVHGVIVASRSMLDDDDISEAEGRIIPIDKGDVLVFYNFEYTEKDTGTPRESFRALHMGMPAEEEKTIANHWFRLVS